MKRSYGLASLGIVTVILAAGVAESVPAQAASDAAPLEVPMEANATGNTAPHQTGYYFIRLKNTTAQSIARQLDPAHNRKPLIVADSRDNQDSSRQPATEDSRHSQKAADLPEGVLKVTPLQVQNGLLIRATPEGLKKIGAIIDSLDQPLRQVEIEAKIVKISPEDLKKLPIEPPALNQNSADGTTTGTRTVTGIGYVFGSFNTRLAELVQQNKAKVTELPRLTAINNNTASITTTASQAITLAVKGDDGQLKPLPDSTRKALATNLSISNSSNLIITPTINNDQTIALVLKLALKLQLISNAGQPGETVISQSTEDFNTLANVRDGDTIALIDIAPPPFFSTGPAPLKDPTPDTASDFVLIITTRILHRVGE